MVAPAAAEAITSGSYRPPGTTAPLTGLPPFCRVALDISSTGHSNTSQIGVEVWLPESGWNGRYLGTGNGGFAGAVSTTTLAGGLREGFAVANTDLGTGLLFHCTGVSCGERSGHGVPPGGLFGHPDAIKDFGYRATHLMTEAAKQVIAAYYGQPEKASYFTGCSTGGQQGLMEAQRFPRDYNGIVAGAPAYDRTHLHMAGSWPYAWTHASLSGVLTVPALTLINRTVLQHCGGQGGGAPGDTFLSQPAACAFDAAILRCTGATAEVPCTDRNASSCTCLSSEQAAAMDAIWHGPVDDQGRQLQPGYVRSSETPVPLAATGGFGNLGLVWAEAAPEPRFDGLNYWALGPDWRWQDFFADPFHPVAMRSQEIRRIDEAQVGGEMFEHALNATDPDLKPFQANGGKLILYQGWTDPLIPGYVAVNYWQALRDTTAAGSYVRLFMAPGMWHCGGGPGANVFGGQDQARAPKPGDPNDDVVAALVRWVENGVAPEQIVATKFRNDTPADGIAFQRPLCAYPNHAQYRGSGDPNDPANFVCSPDRNDRISAPAPIYGP